MLDKTQNANFEALLDEEPKQEKPFSVADYIAKNSRRKKRKQK